MLGRRRKINRSPLKFISLSYKSKCQADQCRKTSWCSKGMRSCPQQNRIQCCVPKRMWRLSAKTETLIQTDGPKAALELPRLAIHPRHRSAFPTELSSYIPHNFTKHGQEGNVMVFTKHDQFLDLKDWHHASSYWQKLQTWSQEEIKPFCLSRPLCCVMHASGKNQETPAKRAGFL